ncbi:MAG TPA: GntR family transcriptional regulator [Chondromyces sp.]|nr:GntR family transcriptional regulator [Chondromyces sp.]
MFELDLRSRQPIYEQLIEKLKEMIIHEVYKPDEKLPSVRVLAKELTINPNTIQKAYRELEREGYIYSLAGKGSFVSPQQRAVDEQRVRKMKNELVRLISEALYLGIDKKDIQQLIMVAEERVKGGERDDRN